MKKMYASALACFGFAAPLFVQAQNQPGRSQTFENRKVMAVDAVAPGRSCSTMEVFEAQLAADPARAQRMAAIEAHTKRVLAQPALLQRATAGTPVVIPVVVHVLYNTAAQNISDAQVQSQIDVLNEDYAKANADATQVPGAFAALAANTNIQFVLAKRDPAGAATNGIIHKFTKVASWSTNDAVKSSKRGGDNAWDATKYLNLWACNLGQGLLGYAQFPGGAPSTDGVVCLYSAVGSRAKVPGGTYVNAYDLGRTTTHEVGHWLNLRHIWGDANCGNDLVNDTPTQQTSNYGCPTFPHVTCSNQGDMSMNYMDYTDDKCMYMLTTDQSARMNALFATGGARAGLTTSLGGTALRTLATAAATFYPNPATDVLNVDVPAGARGVTSVRVYDLRGQEMTQARYNGEGQVRVAALPKGLYYLRVANGGAVTHQRFEKE